MKQIFTYFAIVLLISGCLSNPSTDHTSTPQHTVSGKQVNTQSMTCGNYQTQVNQAKQAKNLPRLSSLLSKLKRQPDCSVDLDTLKRDMSEIAADKAEMFVQRGKLEAAEKWLGYQYAPVTSWKTQAVRGEIATKHELWKDAAYFYNQALDLIDNPKDTPNPPSEREIKKMIKLADEAQLLAGVIVTTKSEPCNIIRESVRGIDIVDHPIPVQFIFEQTSFTDKGKNSAQKLASYLKCKKARSITLVGHTDHHGEDDYNCNLSKNRALALKDFLVAKGIKPSFITTVGKGEREHYEPYNRSRYTQAKIEEINRRVEFFTDPSEVLHAHKCE